MIEPSIINDWHAISTVKDIHESKLLQIRLLEHDIVLWEADDGLHAMYDRCPHRGTRLSLGKVNDNQLICSYHGWQFSTEGKCTYQPAQPDIKPSPRTCVQSYSVKEDFGLVWVCLGEPGKTQPNFPGLDEDYNLVITGPYDVKTSAPRVVENFLDLAHFPFVHAGILGEEPYTEIKDYDVQITGQGVEIKNVHIRQPNASTVHTDPMEVTYSYNILRPYQIMLTKQPQTQEGKPTDLIFLTVSPREELDVRAWIIMATTYGTKESEQSVHDFQDNIFRQDKDILESQRPQRLPLSNATEMHQRADKASVEYRKWLKELGITYGTTDH